MTPKSTVQEMGRTRGMLVRRMESTPVMCSSAASAVMDHISTACLRGALRKMGLSVAFLLKFESIRVIPKASERSHYRIASGPLANAPTAVKQQHTKSRTLHG